MKFHLRQHWQPGADPEPPFEPNSDGWAEGTDLCWIAKHWQNIGMFNSPQHLMFFAAAHSLKVLS